MQFLQTTIVTGVWWQQTIVILMLVMLNNVPNVFGNADNGQQQSYHSDDNNNADRSGKQPVYEEFFIEHNVSQKDAIKSFKEYAQKLLLTSECCSCQYLADFANETKINYILNSV